MEKSMSQTPKVTVMNMSKFQLGLVLVILCLLIAGAAGCAPVGQATREPSATPGTTEQPLEPTALPPTETNAGPVPTGWETYTSSQFQYDISYPAGMEVTGNGDYSSTLGPAPANPDEAARNFIYVSVIPANFQGSDGEIYNYNKAEADILLNMQVGESKSLREGADEVEGFTYTRKTDTVIDGEAAKTYENSQPWEFPTGTKEIRFYLQTDTYTYLIGGYIDSAGTNQPGTITEELFNQIVATFRLTH
jgi:hypothetical protein